jgi:hypothetical protein
MGLRPLHLFMFAQGCVAAAISIPSVVPTLELRKARSVGPVRRQVANLDASTRIDYLANVTFGQQTFELNIDTGSSDTWVAEQGFTCDTADCEFGPRYVTPGTFVPIEDVSITRRNDHP